MSRQFNSAAVAYSKMDLDGFAKLEDVKKPENTGGGLLARTSKPMKASDELDYTNPAVRVAKQMQVIRKYRDEINGTK
jgi:hypothetical protein